MSVQQREVDTRQVPPVQQRVMEFIRRHFHPGYNHFNVTKLVGDASARQYYRYFSDDGGTWILAAYPQPFDPASFPYLEIYRLLQSIGVPVPRIHDLDGELGIVLQQDLGDESLQRRLRRTDREERRRLFGLALDHVVAMQTAGSRAFSPECEGYHLAFDEAKLTWEFDFFRKHYLHGFSGRADADDILLNEECVRIAQHLAALPRVFCHRDYHVRNLMWAVDTLFVIDFQDARWGPPCYDLVSLLKDSLDLEDTEVRELTEGYVERLARAGFAGLPRDLFRSPRFEWDFHLMCIQRLLKALGTYAYQITVRGNFIYEQYIPGSLHRALQSLEFLGEFPRLHRLVATELESRF
jgi:hypothetical protein